MEVSHHQPYAENQPTDGEIILVCDHIRRGRKWHWFCYRELGKFTKPDGSTGESRWIAICEECFASCTEPEEMIRDDVVWTGDDPAIREFRGA